MRLVTVAAAVGLLAVLAAAAPAAAQSLADVARQEAARRAAIGSTAKVYTNDDLTPDPTAPGTGSAPGAPSAAPAGPPGDGAGTPGAGASASPSTADEEEYHIIQRPDDRGEDYWRGRATRIQQRLARARTDADGFEARLAALPSGTSDEDREAARATAERARRDVASLEAEWTRFEAEARAANVPLSWIR
ncbi:MAG: hypothetical protein AB7H88_14375 [Vicinamibacterales bacterium]